MLTTFKYDHYYLYDELKDCLKILQDKYPHLMSVESICETDEQKQVFAVTLTNQNTGAPHTKPAFYMDGNHHAGEVTGSMAAMHTIDYLVTNESPLLNDYTVYVIPRMSPDGAEAYLTSAEKLRSVNRNYPYEEKEAGLHPSDLDGDGVIRLMRVKSPYGAWKISSDDSRIMIKRQPDEVNGDFYNVYPEGEIVGFDGINIKLAKNKWGLDFNRNYPFGWFPDARQPGSGKYPLSNPENKAVADFIINHSNISLASTLHTSGGMIIYPPGIHPEKKAHPFDMKLYKTIGKMGTDETTYPCYNIFDAFLTDTVNYSSGAFDDWCYFTQGILTYTVELWDMKKHAGISHTWPRIAHQEVEKELEDYKKQLAWIDTNVSKEAGFKEWTKINHPQLGEVEIGGCDFKYTMQNCPPHLLQTEIENNTKFMLRQIATLPKLVFASVEVIQVAPNLYQMEVVVSNQGYLPTYVCEQAKMVKVDQPVTVSCVGEVKLINSEETQTIGHLEGFSGIKTEYSYDGIQTENHAPILKKVTWLIQAKTGTTVTLIATQPKAGRIEKSMSL